MTSQTIYFTINSNTSIKQYEFDRYFEVCKNLGIEYKTVSSHAMYYEIDHLPTAAINMCQQVNETHLRFLRYYEILGVSVLNPVLSSRIADDKMLSHYELLKLGYKVPKTYDFHTANYNHKILDSIGTKLGYPYVIKVPDQAQGIGVCLIKNEHDARDIFDLIYALSFRHGDYVTTGNVIAQEAMTTNLGTDIRAMVLGNQFLGAMIRISNTDWKARRAPGPTPWLDNSITTYEKYNLPEHIQEKCILAAKKLNLDFAGFDLFYHNEDFYFGEINTQPNLRRFEACFPELDVAALVIKYLIDK